jgi:hypothetical protein
MLHSENLRPGTKAKGLRHVVNIKREQPMQAEAESRFESKTTIIYNVIRDSKALHLDWICAANLGSKSILPLSQKAKINPSLSGFAGRGISQIWCIDQRLGNYSSTEKPSLRGCRGSTPRHHIRAAPCVFVFCLDRVQLISMQVSELSQRTK